MSPHSKPARRPKILIGATEADRLTALAGQAGPTSTGAALLLEELDRAEIRPDARMPADVVRMYSRVEFVDERTNAARTVQLVYPLDADIEADRISVLTPVGAGLIGLAPGQAILWPDRNGNPRPLRVVSVVHLEGATV